MGDIKTLSEERTAWTLQKIKGINYQLGQSRPVLNNASRNRFILYNLPLLFRHLMQMHLRSQSQLRPEFPYICPKLLSTSLGTLWRPMLYFILVLQYCSSHKAKSLLPTTKGELIIPFKRCTELDPSLLPHWAISKHVNRVQLSFSHMTWTVPTLWAIHSVSAD
jgi:hypothetical protein